MASIHKSALVPHSAQLMFDLVDDIDAYQDFLPHCTGSRVLARGDDEVRATIELAKGGIAKSFTTHNRMQPGKMIEMKLIEGPFKHLQGFWQFQALDEQACKVSLDLEFEFSGRLVSMAFGPIFHQIANTLVDAFCRRADALHGPGAAR